MTNQDQGFLDDMRKASPDYKFAKEYLAGIGIDIDTMQPAMARTPNFDPKVMAELGISMAPPPDTNQYSEPIGPPSPFNEHGQPGAQLGLYRKVANKAARGVGFVARGVAAGLGMTAPNLQQGAEFVGEGATRGILTQALPGVAELPQNVMRWSEDMGGLAKMGLVEIMRSMADMAGKKGDAVGAQEFYDQAATLESANPADVFVASEVMERGLAKVINEPQSSGERAWRDAFSIISSMALTKNVGPTVGANATRAAKLAENAIRGGIADFVVSDPRREGSVEGVLNMLAPELGEGFRNYISTGGVEAEEDLKLRLNRRLGEVGFGAVTGVVFDSLMAGAKNMRLSRIADDWTEIRSKITPDAPNGPEVSEQVAKVLDDLDNLLKPEGGPQVNAGAAAEAEAAGLKPVDARDTGVRLEGTEEGPLPDAALGRLGQLPTAREWLMRQEGRIDRQVIETLDSALGEVNDIQAVGTRASRQAGREQQAAQRRPIQAAINEDEQAAMVGGVDETPTAQASEDMAQVGKLQDEEDALLAQSRQRADMEAGEEGAEELGRLQDEDDLERRIGTLEERNQLFHSASAEKSAPTDVEDYDPFSDPADDLFAELDINPDFREVDEWLSGQSMARRDDAPVADTRPVSRGSVTSSIKAKSQTPEDTALSYIIAQSEKGWTDYDRTGAASLMAHAHGITEQEAQRLLGMAESLAKDPTTETYVKVAQATNQPVEQTAVDVALAMNPFPQSVVKEADGGNLPLYHGATKDYKEMDDAFLGSGAGTNRYGKGHHFSDTELAGEYAKGEGGNIRKAYLDIRNPVDMDAPVSDQMMEVLGAEGRAMDVDPDDAMKDVYDRWVLDLTEQQGMEIGVAKDYISAKFEEAGFDGLTYKFGDMGQGDHTVWVAFHAKQVKNAFGGLEGAAEQIARTMEKPAPKAKAARQPRGQGAGAKQAAILAEKMEREMAETGTVDIGRHVTTQSRTARDNNKKAMQSLMQALRMRNSPIVKAISEDPRVVEILGTTGALVLAMRWAMDNVSFEGEEDEIGKVR